MPIAETLIRSRWTDRAMPWVHFVPIKLDFSDLHDAAAFFRGLPDGTPGHDELAKKIAHSGKEWIAKYWRREVSLKLVLV